MASRDNHGKEKRSRDHSNVMSRSDRPAHKRQRVEPRASKQDVELPLGARPLSKYDLSKYRALFGLYLDVQKELSIDELDDTEVKGRWKSFLGKWNRGELSEGYYDPKMKAKADLDAASTRSDEAQQMSNRKSKDQVQAKSTGTHDADEHVDDDDDDDDEFGPAPAGRADRGAAGPTSQDLQYRDEMNAEAREQARESSRFERKAERKQQRERLDDIVPRAEPGTKERQLEKRREKSDANRAFRDDKGPGTEEVGDRDLMGEDGFDQFRAQVKEQERRKTERELRREEVLRARAAEREERLSAFRSKEAKTMDMLKEIAQQRFG